MIHRYVPNADGSPGGRIFFTCTTCGEESHVQVHPDPAMGRPYWTLVSVEPLAMTPSVRWFGHMHFNITKDGVVMHADEPCTRKTT